MESDESLSGAGSRADGNSECSLSSLDVTNVIHQRRRVNPESLALRLGPELVRDLDALITPGNTEMPSFAVRKELQERYSIDRRHIYDYFHSRGLRVVKEDKHGNPVVAKDLPITPLPNLRPLRQAPVKNSRSLPSYLVAAEKNLTLFKPRGVTKAKPGRPKKNPLANPKIVPIACETNIEPTDTNLSEPSSPGAVPKPIYVAVNPLLPHSPLPPTDENCTFNSVITPLDESFSVSRAIGDIAYAYRHKLVFERMQELTEYPVKLAPADDQSLLWNEASPCSASARGLLLPHEKPLSRDERHVIYEALSDSLGPAHGIQECQGTYRKHMEARAKRYFQGLVSVPYHQAQQPARTSTASDRKLPLGTNEFRHWLSETRFLKRDGTHMNSSPRLHPNHRNANVAKRQDMDGANKHFRQKSIPHWLQTLDDLFPTLGDDWHNNDPLPDSPIDYAQEITRTITHARDVASERDRPLFFVTSGPVTSVAEDRPTGQPQFHGPSAFPWSQEVKMRMPVAEMDNHQERVPYAPSSDALRRGRNNARNFASRSPRKSHVRDLDRIRTRPVTSRDARRRTTSGAGDI